MKKLFLLYAICILAAIQNNAQDTIHVPADYSTIQAGIDAASTSDIVLVAEGTYYENINFKGKAITVASNFIIDGDTNHVSNTIIDGSQPINPDSASVVTFESGEDTTSVLYGFTITGGSGTLSHLTQSTRRGGGVLCYQSGARIEYNIIKNNECLHQQYAYGGGICQMNVSGDPNFSYVVVENNKIRNNRCESSENNAAGGGIFFRGEGRIVNNTILNNEAEFNGAAGSNRASFGGGISCGWWDTGYPYVKIYNNLIANNRALSNNPLGGGYCGGVDIEVTICDFRGNTVKDNKVSGAPVAIGGGMQVMLSLLPASVIENNFINNGPLDATVTVIGGGLITVQTENLTVENNVFQFNSGQYGGGIYISEDSVISVRNNKFLQNSATDGGGGIFISQSSPLFENNLVVENTALVGGGVSISSTGEKSKDKSGIDPQMMLSGGLGEITSENNVINTLPTPVKKNTTFVGEPLFINNTIVDNSATAQGGGIYNELSQPIVLNTILYGNTAAQDSQIYILNGDVFVRYSDVEGDSVYPGEGNIEVYPEFVDTANGDYRLSDISLCIGAGIDSIEIGGIWFYAPLNDIEGNPRPDPTGSMPDIGAYESPLDSPVYVEKYETLIPVEYALQQNYPNPFNPSTTIEIALPTPGFVTLSIFNILGEKVATLISENLAAGSYKYHWDAKRLTSGIYFYQLLVSALQSKDGKASSFVETKKMLLLK